MGTPSKPNQIRCGWGRERVQIHNTKPLYRGYFGADKYHLTAPRLDGEGENIVTREIFLAGEAVIILPYDPVRDRVLLVEQIRMGPLARGDKCPWVLEPVAGRIDPGETREEAAHREAKEEAGLHLKELEFISSHYASPGATTEYYHCYVGICDLPHMKQGSGGLESEQEDIRTHVLTADAAIDLIKTGEADAGPLVTLLLWLKLERPRLRSSA